MRIKTNIRLLGKVKTKTSKWKNTRYYILHVTKIFMNQSTQLKTTNHNYI